MGIEAILKIDIAKRVLNILQAVVKGLGKNN